MNLTKDKPAKVFAIGSNGDTFSSSIKDINGTEVSAGTMTEITTSGVFYYDWTPDTAGYYTVSITSVNGFETIKVVHVNSLDDAVTTKAELTDTKIQIINSLVDPPSS